MKQMEIRIVVQEIFMNGVNIAQRFHILNKWSQNLHIFLLFSHKLKILQILRQSILRELMNLLIKKNLDPQLL
uniref:Uncharacterized protein n=1 Tax=Rhizophagus irregularis (strain DAOM 181602 / DAOM 197198 / MUCL 43194) TaxID=747089 RepID=U9UEH4_RHIID